MENNNCTCSGSPFNSGYPLIRKRVNTDLFLVFELREGDKGVELSKEEALLVTNIGNLQMPHDCKFREFKYFENVTNAVQFHFPDTNVEIVVPSQITTIPVFFYSIRHRANSTE